jgi:hypothetical protein
LPLISDPFGVGEDFFGTTHLAQQPIIPPASFVWHTQVGLILLGHLVSVYLAHVQALRIFPGKHKALWRQFPMLILMIAFTTVGLWILSLPIGAGQVIDPLPTLSALPPPKPVGDVAGGSGTTHPVMTWLRMRELSPGKEQRGSVSSLPMPALQAIS